MKIPHVTIINEDIENSIRLQILLAMTTRIYILLKSREGFFPLKINEISKTELCGEISDFGINQNFDGIFEANIYHDGKLSDIENNGWTFSCHIKGNYHVPGTYHSTSYEIECIDPDDNELKLYSTPYKIRFSEEYVLCNYLEFVNLYSKFENADIALKFNYLSRLLDEGMYGARGRDPMKIKYEGVLDLIKFFKGYYEELEKRNRKNKLLMEKIKEAVNGVLDFLKRRLDFDKIE